MMYSLLEQHRNGAWWYHPGDKVRFAIIKED